MKSCIHYSLLTHALLCLIATYPITASAEARQDIDYLSLAQGAIPVTLKGDAKSLRVGMDHALQIIDGDPGGFTLTAKPGHANSKIVIVYELPALTTFKSFVIPNILETPSPSQTFIKSVEIAGSNTNANGPFQQLASSTLTTHADKGQSTALTIIKKMPVRWVQLTLTGGIDIQRDKTFFEFSEIIGHGEQEPVPQSTRFTGKWKGQGVLLELKQEGVQVTGCYDGTGVLDGTVSGNVLRATGKSRNGDIPSAFVLIVGDQGGVSGVRSTNGAPFRLYTGDLDKNSSTTCSNQQVQPLGCGSIIHGIHFDFDSATIQAESEGLLDTLAAGLISSSPAAFTVIGHTSSEGTDAYNDKLSQRRAEAVVAAIVARGIDPTHISAQGRGEQQPIADNSTEAGRSLNRRVEIACR